MYPGIYTRILVSNPSEDRGHNTTLYLFIISCISILVICYVVMYNSSTQYHVTTAVFEQHVDLIELQDYEPLISQPTFIGHGLINRGQACFVNSILQVLRFTPEFSLIMVKILLQIQSAPPKPIDSSTASPSEVHQYLPVLQEFIRLIVAMQVSKQSIDPQEFLVECSKITELVTVDENYRDNGQEQQDAEEFLLILLDMFHELTIYNTKNQADKDKLQQEKQTLEERLKLNSRSDDPTSYAQLIMRTGEVAWKSQAQSIVSKLFSGQEVRGSVCLNCQRMSTSHQEMRVLQLSLTSHREFPSDHHDGNHNHEKEQGSDPIQDDHVLELSDCLRQYSETEELDGSERRVCLEGCGELAKWTTQTLIQRLPPIFVIHLKRFEIHSGYGKKLDTQVEFPFCDLDMTPTLFLRDMEHPLLYDLYAICSHRGTSIDSGHYIAYVKATDSNEHECSEEDANGNPSWYLFNDDEVTLLDEQEVMEETLSNAYILFYRQQQSLPETQEATPVQSAAEAMIKMNTHIIPELFHHPHENDRHDNLRMRLRYKSDSLNNTAAIH